MQVHLIKKVVKLDTNDGVRQHEVEYHVPLK